MTSTESTIASTVSAFAHHTALTDEENGKHKTKLNQRGGKLLSKGAFGCVYHPALDCKLIDTKYNKLASKLQFKDKIGIREGEIGEIVRRIPNYSAHFAPILEQCDVSPSRMIGTNYDSCPILKEPSLTSEIMLSRMTFVPGVLLMNYMWYLQKTPSIIPVLYRTYRSLLDSLILLQNAHVVHYDFADHNIMIHQDTKSPIIIDFGLGIDMKLAEKEATTNVGVRKWFYGFLPEVSFRPPEIHFLCAAAFQNKVLTATDVETIATTIMQKNNNLKLARPQFIAVYTKLLIDEAKNYIGLSAPAIFERIKKYYKTWDNFALSMLYAEYILKIVKLIESSPEIADSIISSNRMFDIPMFLKNFLELQIINIHPNPEKRLSLEKTIHVFNSIIHKTTV